MLSIARRFPYRFGTVGVLTFMRLPWVLISRGMMQQVSSFDQARSKEVLGRFIGDNLQMCRVLSAFQEF